jgi:pyruvate/2-oxoglutarate dehydrogenase complex dihydrolipoamide dehydrogenase (E3) component
LRACATRYDRTIENDRLGVYTDLITTNWPTWLEVQHRTTSRLAEELSRALDRAGAEVKFGTGELFDAHTVVITDDLGKKESVTSEYIILATGSRPAFRGNEKARVLNSDQLLKSSLVPKNLFVIGGGYIGCELAAIFAARKVPVTLVEAESRLLPTWDQSAGDRMREVLELAGVQVMLKEKVELPSPDQNGPIHFKLRNGTVVTPDLTLVTVGRVPNTEKLNLSSVGLPTEGFLEVDAQTKVSSIFAIGDVNGMMLFDSAAFAQARVAVQTILGEKAMFESHWIPRCLHTEPPIAGAGWTQAEAVAAGHQVDVISADLSLITDDDATMIEPDKNLLKLIVQSSTGRILGCLAIGSRAAELINLGSMAIRSGVFAQRLADLSLIHPSASEAMVRLLRDYFDRRDRC